MRRSEGPDQEAAAAHAQPGGPLPDGLLVAAVRVDTRGRIRHWDAAAEALLGHPAAEMLGTRGELLGPGEARAGLRPLLERIAAGGAAPGTYTARHRDGHLVELAVWACAAPAGGDVPALLVDASAARERRMSRTLLDGLFHHSPIGQSAFDGELGYLRVNPALEEINGLSEAEHLGRRLSEVLPDVNDVETVLRQVLDTGEPVVGLRVTGRAPAAPHEERVWSWSYFRLEDPGGRPFGVGASVVDITARVRADQEAAAGRRRLGLLNEAGARMSSTLDMRQTAQELADVALRGLADLATVDLVAGVTDGAAEPAGELTGDIVVRRLGRASVRDSSAGRALAPLGATLHHFADAPYARALARGAPFVVTGMDDTALTVFPGHSATLRQLRELGVHSLLALPLLARGRALGAAAFYRVAPAPPFSPDDVALARDLTSRAVVYLDNARLYTREHTTAVTLQRSLLPYRLTPPPGIEVAHCYRPASEAQEAGGDWYDVVALPGGRAALMVGDVMGHGIVAAAAMGRLRSTMRALARLELPPEQLLRQLDATLADSPGTPLATCVYAVCDPAAASCSITRAGHLPPVVVRPDGSAEPVQLPTGVPLGVGGGDFVPTEVPLPPGSVLALYTDGLVKVRGADLDERVAQLCDVLTAGSALPLNDLGRSAVVRLAPAPDDDVALLLAAIRPQGHEKER